MPVLENARHERFAQELAKGKTQEQAYIDAGYSENGARVSASQLLTNPNVAKRLTELQERAAIRVEWDVVDAIRELEEARVAAGSAETVQASAMISATMGKAKLLGLVVDKAESKTTISFEDALAALDD
jgi:phage terminase small subunit